MVCLRSRLRRLAAAAKAATVAQPSELQAAMVMAPCTSATPQVAALDVYAEQLAAAIAGGSAADLPPHRGDVQAYMRGILSAFPA